MFRRVPHLIALFWPLAVFANPCELGALSPSAPSQTKQFAFLVGDHDVTLHARQGAGWSPPRPVGAAWRGWYGLQGQAIYDEWTDPDVSQIPGGSHGVNVRMFDPDEQLWKMMWISTATHQVQDLRAEIREGVLTMWQVYPERPGWKAEFTVTDERHWERISYVRNEQTGTWDPQFRLAATKVAAPDGSSSCE